MKAEKVLLDSLINTYEIGARGGAFQDFDDISGVVNYIGFEPDSAECTRLNELAAGAPRFREEEYHPVALGGRSGRQKLNLTRQPGCSSFLEADIELARFYNRSRWFEIDQSFELPTIQFSEFLQTTGRPNPDFIKIDVEGMELEIIEGLGESIKDVLGMRVEVNYLAHRYEQTRFGELVSFMESHGFRVYRFLENHAWRTDSMYGEDYAGPGQLKFSRGQLAHGDVLFFRCPYRLCSDQSITKTQAFKSVMILVSYGFFSHAKSVWEKRLRSDTELEVDGEVINELWFVRKSWRFTLHRVFDSVRRLGMFISTTLRNLISH